MKTLLIALLCVVSSGTAAAAGGFVASVVREDDINSTVQFKKNTVSLDDLEMFARIKAQLALQFGAKASSVVYTVDPAHARVLFVFDKKTTEMRFEDLPALE